MESRSRTGWIVVVSLVVMPALAGCPGEEEPLEADAGHDVGEEVGPEPDVEGDVGDAGEDPDVEEPAPEYPLATCDGLNPEVCAFPWPSNLYLAPDESTATGYRLRFDHQSLPANAAGVHLRPGLVSHLDGFDLGVPIMVLFPSLDGSGLPDEYHIEDSLAGDASILLFEVTGGGLSRVPYFAELDSLEDDPELRTLFIRPAVILEEGTRYVVALRDLETLDGEAIEASEEFAALVAGETGDDPVLRHRQARFDELFGLLDGEGIDAEELVLAWDFVTASSEAIHGPVLAIRDDGFEYVEEHGIRWTIDEVVEYLPEEDPDDSDTPWHPHIGLEIRATLEVPHYLEPYPQVSGTWQLHYDEEGRITRNGTREAPVVVRLPHRAVNGEAVDMIVYGHGLLGSRWGIHGDYHGILAEEYGYGWIAVDMIGMSNAESTAAFQAVMDGNHFIALSHRLHQGMLEYMLAARTAITELPELEVLTERDIELNTDEVYYMGGSQGGIFGSTFMALTPDVKTGYLAVPGNNYSTLLHRSVNFDEFNAGLANTYPVSYDRNQMIAVLSLLWSHTDPVSYLRRITHDPFAGDPRRVLLAVAKGDWQVSVMTNEITARSGIDIPLMENYDSEREPFGVEVATYPHEGSGVVNFDFGNPWPPPGNVVPFDEFGDPHNLLGGVMEAGPQLDHFLRHGEIIDICDGEPCQF